MPDPESQFDVSLDTGLFHLLGGGIEEMSSARVVLTMPADERHLQPFGLVHGGVYCALVETAASFGASVYAMEHGHFAAVGVSNTTDFLRSHRGGLMRAEATPIHQGRTQQLWNVSVTRAGDGKELATGRVRLQNITGHEIAESKGETPG